MTDRDDLLRRVRRANPAPVGQDLPAGIADSRPPLEWLIEGKYSMAATTRSEARRRGLIAAAAGLAAVVAVVLALLLWPRSGDPAPFIEEGSTIPETTVTATTTAAPAVGKIVAAPAPAEGTSLSPGGLVAAVSGGEAWAVPGVGGAEDSRLIGHLKDGAWTYWRFTNLTAWCLDLAVAPNGTVWAVTTVGVFSFDGEEWIRRSDTWVGEWTEAVTVAWDGTVWIGGTLEGGGTPEGGLAPWAARWDGEAFTRVDPWPQDSPGPVGVGNVAMAATPDGEVWVAATGWLLSDLMRYHGQTMETVQIGDYKDPRPDEAMGPVGVFDIEVAPNGDTWVGGWVVGDWGQDPLWDQEVLARYDGAEWTLYDWPFTKPANSLRQQLLFDLAVGADGTLWVAFPGGLGSYDGTTWSLRAADAGIAGMKVTVDVAPDGTVWYTGSDGLNTFTP